MLGELVALPTGGELAALHTHPGRAPPLPNRGEHAALPASTQLCPPAQPSCLSVKTQFPHSSQAKDTGRAQRPLVSLHVADVKVALLELAPTSRIAPTEEFNASQSGCTPAMLWGGLECKGLAHFLGNWRRPWQSRRVGRQWPSARARPLARSSNRLCCQACTRKACTLPSRSA